MTGSPCSPLNLGGLVILVAFAFGFIGCRKATSSQGHAPGSRASTPHLIRTPPPLALDAVFESPSGLYSIRYDHAWKVQQLPNPSGGIDYFTLADATISIVTGSVVPGTTLDTYAQQTEASYQKLNLQGLEPVGAVDVGGGQGEMLRAVTYVTVDGQTVATPPTPNSPPHTFYQALYIAGGHSFAFSIAWPENDSTDYLSLFRSLLRTFTLAGAS